MYGRTLEKNQIVQNDERFNFHREGNVLVTLSINKLRIFAFSFETSKEAAETRKISNKAIELKYVSEQLLSGATIKSIKLHIILEKAN